MTPQVNTSKETLNDYEWLIVIVFGDSMEIEKFQSLFETWRQFVFRRVGVRRIAGIATRVCNKLSGAVMNWNDDAANHETFRSREKSDSELVRTVRQYAALCKIR